MSDYIVYKKTKCWRCCERPPYECGTCKSSGFILEEIDLEEAVIEVLVKSLQQHSRLSRLIRQTSREVMYR